MHPRFFAPAVVSSLLRLTLSASLLCSAHAASAQNGAVNLGAATTVPEVQAFDGAVVGHFRTGRRMDFVVGGYDHDSADNPGYANVLLNNGNGTFAVQPGPSYDPPEPNFAADLDGDGISDLGFYYYSGVPLAVEYGNGDGTFSNPVQYPTDTARTAPAFVATGDFNGDGRTDLAIVTSANQLVILLNKGSRVFQPAYTYPLPASSGNVGLYAGDLNGDHKTDLVFLYSSTTAKLLPFFATGGGAFRQGSISDSGVALNNSAEAALGDINRDGYGDLAFLTAGGIKIMLGTSSGSFRPGALVSSPAQSTCYPGISCLALSDFNKDGKLDLAVAGAPPMSFIYGQSAVSVFFGDGSGNFASPSVYGIPQGVSALIAADLNNTGNTDLAVASHGTGSLILLLNQGNGYFKAPLTSPAPNAVGITTADFDRDGKPDVAVVNTPACKAPCGGTVTVLPGSGSTYFGPARKYNIGMHGSAIASGDLNGDGITDLVVVNATTGDNADLSVLLGNADGTFKAAQNYTLGSLSQNAFLADMNKDGKLDLVEDGGVAFGHGDGSFGALHPFPGGLGYAYAPFLSVGDFNGDGWLDIAIASTGNCTSVLNILLNDKKGGLLLGQNFFNEGGQPYTGIAAGKLHGGTVLDLVTSFSGGCNQQVAGANQSGLSFYKGNGNGTFGNATPLLSSSDFRRTIAGPIAIADFNGDGKLDIGVTGTEFFVFPGRGDGSFSGPLDLTGLSGAGSVPISPASSLAVADFDHNGLPDVMLTNILGVARLYAHPVPSVTPSVLTWTAAGTSRTLTVKNTLPTAQLIGASIASSAGSSAFKTLSNTCHASLAPGATCSVTLLGQSTSRVELLITDAYSIIATVPLNVP